MIRAVVFDLDGTLLDHSESLRVGVSAIGAYLPRPRNMSTDELAYLWQEEAERYMQLYLSGRMSFNEQRTARVKAVFSRLGQETPSDGLIAEILAVYVPAYQSAFRVYPDVFPCLQTLSSYRLGLVTNGDPDQQHLKLSKTGLEHYFRATIVSGLAVATSTRRRSSSCVRANSHPSQVGSRRFLSASGTFPPVGTFW